jgi:hypothetical protein
VRCALVTAASALRFCGPLQLVPPPPTHTHSTHTHTHLPRPPFVVLLRAAVAGPGPGAEVSPGAFLCRLWAFAGPGAFLALHYRGWTAVHHSCVCGGGGASVRLWCNSLACLFAECVCAWQCAPTVHALYCMSLKYCCFSGVRLTGGGQARQGGWCFGGGRPLTLQMTHKTSVRLRPFSRSLGQCRCRRGGATQSQTALHYRRHRPRLGQGQPVAWCRS